MKQNSTSLTRKRPVYNLVLAAMFLALGIILPFFTGQIPQIGNMLLPMHLPVFLCGLICGWPYGLAVGLVLPLLRHLLFAMPPLISAVTMAFELAAYGACSGALYRLLPKRTPYLYVSLLAAMVDRKSTRLNSSHKHRSRMPSSA